MAEIGSRDFNGENCSPWFISSYPIARKKERKATRMFRHPRLDAKRRIIKKALPKIFRTHYEIFSEFPAENDDIRWLESQRLVVDETRLICTDGCDGSNLHVSKTSDTGAVSFYTDTQKSPILQLSLNIKDPRFLCTRSLTGLKLYNLDAFEKSFASIEHDNGISSFAEDLIVEDTVSYTLFHTFYDDRLIWANTKNQILYRPINRTFEEPVILYNNKAHMPCDILKTLTKISESYAPHSLIAAGPSQLIHLDFRAPNLESVPLLNEGPLTSNGNFQGKLIALGSDQKKPYRFAFRTQSHVYLYDLRSYKSPLLEWDLNVKSFDVARSGFIDFLPMPEDTQALVSTTYGQPHNIHDSLCLSFDNGCVVLPFKHISEKNESRSSEFVQEYLGMIYSPTKSATKFSNLFHLEPIYNAENPLFQSSRFGFINDKNMEDFHPQTFIPSNIGFNFKLDHNGTLDAWWHLDDGSVHYSAHLVDEYSALSRTNSLSDVQDVRTYDEPWFPDLDTACGKRYIEADFSKISSLKPDSILKNTNMESEDEDVSFPCAVMSQLQIESMDMKERLKFKTFTLPSHMSLPRNSTFFVSSQVEKKSRTSITESDNGSSNYVLNDHVWVVQDFEDIKDKILRNSSESKLIRSMMSMKMPSLNEELPNNAQLTESNISPPTIPSIVQSSSPRPAIQTHSLTHSSPKTKSTTPKKKKGFR